MSNLVKRLTKIEDAVGSPDDESEEAFLLIRIEETIDKYVDCVKDLEAGAFTDQVQMVAAFAVTRSTLVLLIENMEKRLGL